MKSSYRLGAIVFALAATVSTAAANETYKIDTTHSSIGFHLGHMMGKVVGKFTKFEGKIDIDREHPQQSSVTVGIQAGSIDTGIHNETSICALLSPLMSRNIRRSHSKVAA
jgi:polyisoprenoid-binding protein YceI